LAYLKEYTNDARSHERQMSYTCRIAQLSALLSDQQQSTNERNVIAANYITTLIFTLDMTQSNLSEIQRRLRNACCLLRRLVWWRRQQVPPKRRHTSARRHGSRSQNTVVTAAGFS